MWIVQYEGTQGEGAGVVVLVNGRLLGGDHGYTYEGEYVVKENWIAASIHVANFLPNVPSVLGFVGDFDVQLIAPVREHEIRGTVSVIGRADFTVAVRLIKKAEL